ncbi:MAG: EamA family transporter [Desulfobacca sp.]|uniref:EamA family transporter n=1 Tax=Desulfobacca sp. TaxID=2067990 RepID=UPI00404A27DA
MSDWFSFALLALLFWGLWGVCSKIANMYLPSWAIFIIEVLVYVVVGGIVWGLQRFALPWSPPGLAAAVAAGLCGGGGLFFFLKALASGPASVVVPLTSLYPLITVLVGVTILAEALTLRQLLGIGLAVVAVWLLST